MKIQLSRISWPILIPYLLSQAYSFGDKLEMSPGSDEYLFLTSSSEID